ncbi:D-amino-acid dehydrogenase [Sphingopyxis sp. YR583]|uniref:NAD(P)/FAD-dependent oxidoreductase n=1 Tax=Sphingopyxis sp. YR583 TaxID=1881047 RepID=UPI0008A73A4D|nr:FAD-dependent oxidoreductase [Sphingopyxis sp. YR583]SEH13859.1 D-amino-acid dehydrogenase [Sphingopyxis sp. YR583]
MSSRSTVVVGAGIVGLAAAVEAQRRGDRVTLFDAADPGMGCSFGNAGIIAASEIFPLITPGRIASLPRMLLARDAPAVIRAAALPQLMPWMMRAATTLSARRQDAITHAIAALNGRAVAAWRDLLAHCGRPDQLREKGMIRLIRDPQDRTELDDVRMRLAQHGLPSRRLDRDDLLALEPALGKAATAGLLHESDADIGEPLALSRSLLARFREAGGSVIRQRVLTIGCDDTAALLVTDAGSHRADRILITTGLASGALLRPLGAAVPLQAERGYHLALPGLGSLLSRPVTFQRESCVATPMDGALRLAGTVEFADAAAPPDWRRAHSLAAFAGRYFDDMRLSADPEVWLGSRPSLPDSLPAIGRLAAMPRIGYAFGHQHLGITQAAVSAQLLCGIMAGEPPFDPAPYDLARF